MKNQKNKILVILGPTASGKSDLAVALAKEFNGEVISADSRQVYKGLDIGSGKITKEEMKGVPHYLLDVVDPQETFTVLDFQKLAKERIEDILRRGKLPIVCGGTGFYIQSIVDNIIFPEVKPNLELRDSLEQMTSTELFSMLKKIDLEKSKEIDAKNPRRLIRAIEIATLGPSMSKSLTLSSRSAKSWKVLQIGVKTEREILKERIAQRFLKRVKQGIVEEAKKLHQAGLTYKRFSEIGLAHKYLALYLQDKISEKEFIEESIKAEQRYAKRQMTWFKTDKRIKWFSLEEKQKNENTVRTFLKNQEQL